MEGALQKQTHFTASLHLNAICTTPETHMTKTNRQAAANMELKRVLNEDSSPRPHKRRSPSSHLPSTPDNFETSSQATNTGFMGNTFSYFDDVSPPSSPSGSPPPLHLGSDELVRTDDHDMYIYQQHDLNMKDLPRTMDPNDLYRRDTVLQNSPPTINPNVLHREDAILQDPSPDTMLLADHEVVHDQLLDPLPDRTPETSLPADRKAVHDQGLALDPQLSTSSPAKSEDTVLLTAYSASERQELYTGWWSDLEIPLKHLAAPKLCSKFPELAEEILSAYLFHVIIVATIWSNYDTWSREFFCQPDTRYNDCGKIYLSPAQRRRLNALDPDKFQMIKVRLDIGTPFRTLFQVAIYPIESETETGYGLKAHGNPMPDPNRPHKALRDLVVAAMRNIQKDGLTQPDQVGLQLHDLDEIAKDFVLKQRPQQEQDERLRHWYHVA